MHAIFVWLKFRRVKVGEFKACLNPLENGRDETEGFAGGEAWLFGCGTRGGIDITEVYTQNELS